MKDGGKIQVVNSFRDLGANINVINHQASKTLNDRILIEITMLAKLRRLPLDYRKKPVLSAAGAIQRGFMEAESALLAYTS